METSIELVCKIQKTRDDAVLPTKAHPSDVGYDLTIVDVVKKIGPVTLYSSELILEPPDGWTVDIVARSSIIKSGYLLANGIGIVDKHYRGKLLVALWKYNPEADDIVLPCKLVQLVFRRETPPITMELVESVDTNTDRSSGGFGSSDLKMAKV